MLSKTYLRLLIISLWLLLAFYSNNFWVILKSLMPQDPSIWNISNYEFCISNYWPVFTLAAVCISLFYIIELTYQRPEHLSCILLWVAGMGLAAIAIFPIGSYDIFGNVAFAHLHAFYGLNPYQASVINISNYLSDPFLKNMWWISHGSPYSPLWSWLSFGFYHIVAGFGLIPLLFGFKFFGLLMHLMITFTIYRIAEAIAKGHGSKAAIIYGMNPLAIFELVVNAHNDGPAILLLLISLYLILQTRYLAGFIITGIAATFKLTVSITIPFIIWMVVKNRGQLYTLLGLCLTVTTVIFIYLPLWTGIDSLNGLWTTLGGYISNSLPTIPYAFNYTQLIRPFRIFGLLAFCLWYLKLLLGMGSRNNEVLIITICLGFIVYYLLGASVVHRWYYLWPMAIIAILPHHPWTKVVIGQTILLLLSYTLYLAFGEGAISNSCTYLLTWIPIILLLIYNSKSNNYIKKFQTFIRH